MCLATLKILFHILKNTKTKVKIKVTNDRLEKILVIHIIEM